jgi:hypothetical protein
LAGRDGAHSPRKTTAAVCRQEKTPSAYMQWHAWLVEVTWPRRRNLNSVSPSFDSRRHQSRRRPAVIATSKRRRVTQQKIPETWSSPTFWQPASSGSAGSSLPGAMWGPESRTENRCPQPPSGSASGCRHRRPPLVPSREDLLLLRGRHGDPLTLVMSSSPLRPCARFQGP